MATAWFSTRMTLDTQEMAAKLLDKERHLEAEVRGLKIERLMTYAAATKTGAVESMAKVLGETEGLKKVGIGKSEDGVNMSI